MSLVGSLPSFPRRRCATLHTAIELMCDLRQPTTESQGAGFASEVAQQRSHHWTLQLTRPACCYRAVVCRTKKNFFHTNKLHKQELRVGKRGRRSSTATCLNAWDNRGNTKVIFFSPHKGTYSPCAAFKFSRNDSTISYRRKEISSISVEAAFTFKGQGRSPKYLLNLCQALTPVWFIETAASRKFTETPVLQVPSLLPNCFPFEKDKPLPPELFFMVLGFLIPCTRQSLQSSEELVPE